MKSSPKGWCTETEISILVRRHKSSVTPIQTSHAFSGQRKVLPRQQICSFSQSLGSNLPVGRQTTWHLHVVRFHKHKAGLDPLKLATAACLYYFSAKSPVKILWLSTADTFWKQRPVYWFHHFPGRIFALKRSTSVSLLHFEGTCAPVPLGAWRPKVARPSIKTPSLRPHTCSPALAASTATHFTVKQIYLSPTIWNL